MALLFKIPTNIKAILKGSKPFELAWNYDQISGQFKSLGNGNISLARYLQASSFDTSNTSSKKIILKVKLA